MRTELTIEQMIDKNFLDKLYGFAYKRCNNSHEAQDLCSEMILNILKGARKNPAIENFYSFAWTIAHRTYADYCEKRTKQKERFIMEAYNEEVRNLETHSIEEYMEEAGDALQIKRIKKEIVFLSKIYRDVMIMYYLDEMKISEIASKLGLTETTIKQRLFSARNTIKKEVEKVESRDLSLKPIRIEFVGMGDPVGNNPAEKAERMLSQNLVYLCKDTARSVKELSDLLNVPMPFIEEELEIQCEGVNGEYGLLKKLENGKYISNFIMLELEHFREVDKMYEQKIETIVERMGAYLQRREKDILDFPFFNKQIDRRFITWSLMNLLGWSYIKGVSECLDNKYFKHIQKREEKYLVIGTVMNQNDGLETKWYGCDGISAYNICGYKAVSMFNLYGERIQQHFACGHDISNDSLLRLTLQAIKGIKRSDLTEDEREVAAKAIEAGYLKIEAGYLYPKILVMDMKDANAFQSLALDIEMDFKDLVEETADELYRFIKKFVPKHLMNEYHMFTMLTSCGLISGVVEECIKKNLLTLPDHTPCAEGTWIMVSE
ncbi:MAG: RNA polymerase sigma factor [Candidatus Niameybacter stercoravium]|nr:RNA polymerase sigma factor [Candidatus Niameybacter stercoravium]